MKYQDLFDRSENVVGAGIGLKRRRGETLSPGVTVLVKRKLPIAALASAEIIPPQYDGLRTDVLEVGEIWAPRPFAAREAMDVILPLTDDPRRRHRPIRCGASVAHKKVTAGTIGAIVKIAGSDEPHIFSNNHVLANSNDAFRGDLIYQPGPADGGGPDDAVATLWDFAKINFGGEPPTCKIARGVVRTGNLAARAVGSSHRLGSVKINADAVNTVDAAVARLMVEETYAFNYLGMNKVWPSEINPAPALGLELMKSGRTTGVTHDRLMVKDAAIDVNYGQNRIGRFEGQYIAGPMSAGGDSGSLVFDSNGLVVGLLFAGSDQVTIINPAYLIMRLFGGMSFIPWPAL